MQGRALVVDDNEVNRLVLGEMLSAAGCLCEAVTSGAEAIAMLRRDPSFDYVLVDCQMPDLDGYATARQIRAERLVAARVPIIAVTADAMASNRQKCLDAGMADIIIKPVSLDSLRDTLARWSAAMMTCTLFLGG